jgi:Holliday junction resolvase-like predicted endonuclease
VPLVSRAIFGFLRLASRRGLAAAKDGESGKERARRRRIAGETYAYWYLRRHGYIFVARNCRVPGDKAEIDLVGYDGDVLAFLEVKARTGSKERPGQPEEAVTVRNAFMWSAWRGGFCRNAESQARPGASRCSPLKAALAARRRFACTRVHSRQSYSVLRGPGVSF